MVGATTRRGGSRTTAPSRPGGRLMIATIRRLARDLLPGLVLPATIYFSLRRHAPTVVALAAASSVPALDALVRLARGRKPSPIGLGFIAVTALSVGLAIWFRSTLFILLRGAVTSGLIGIAFGFTLSRLIASAAGWSTVVTTSSIAIAFGVSVFIGLLFGIYPAVQAAKLDPIEAIRYE